VARPLKLWAGCVQTAKIEAGAMSRANHTFTTALGSITLT
jgi:hypothetical protein